MSSPTTVPQDSLSMMAMWGTLQDFDPNSGGGFEGPEKRLELDLIAKDSSTPKEGMLVAEQSVWEEVVGTLNAKIVSKVSSGTFDSYVLTESSLFVFPHQIVLITCGTTTLLNALKLILEYVEKFGCVVEWASFMRKNYSYPWEQKGPHTTMSSEYKILKESFPKGKPFIFGPIDSDHYFFFVFDGVKRGPGITSNENHMQLNINMYRMDQDVAKEFFSDKFYAVGPETQKVRDNTGLSALLEGWQIQDLLFEPCGYSVNSVLGDDYQTLHITPEEHCSYASYETNSRTLNYKDQITKVLGVFKPQRFTIIALVDPDSHAGRMIAEGKPIGVESDVYEAEYCLLNRTTNEFGPGYFVQKMNYVRWDDPLARKRRGSVEPLLTVLPSHVNSTLS